MQVPAFLNKVSTPKIELELTSIEIEKSILVSYSVPTKVR